MKKLILLCFLSVNTAVADQSVIVTKGENILFEQRYNQSAILIGGGLYRYGGKNHADIVAKHRIYTERYYFDYGFIANKQINAGFGITQIITYKVSVNAGIQVNKWADGAYTSTNIEIQYKL